MTTPKQHALKVAAAKVLSEIVAEGYENLRKEAEPAFAAHRLEHDTTTMSVGMPDGTVLGTLSIWAGPPTTKVNFAAVAAIVIKDDPDEFVEQLRPEALEDESLLEFVRDHMPHLLERKIRDEHLKKVLKKIDANGYLKDAAGARIKVADIKRGEPTGKFSYTALPGAREIVWRAWQEGILQPLIGDLLRPAIEAGGAE